MDAIRKLLTLAVAGLAGGYTIGTVATAGGWSRTSVAFVVVLVAGAMLADEWLDRRRRTRTTPQRETSE